jgi:hypothetical protein
MKFLVGNFKGDKCHYWGLKAEKDTNIKHIKL